MSVIHKKSLSRSASKLALQKNKVYNSLSDAVMNANLNKSEYRRICSILELNLPDVPKANYGITLADAVHENMTTFWKKH